VTPSPIPTYPPSPSALLALLVEREKSRLLGPVITRAIADDPSGAAGARANEALAQLESALAWVKFMGASDVSLTRLTTEPKPVYRTEVACQEGE